MKKLILSTALIAISLQGGLFAQDDNESYALKLLKMSKAEQTFNANEGLINIRDFITLKEGRLILEMAGIDDYESFRNLDSILLEFRKDIAFYKDSLAVNPTGNFRIDYCFSPGFSFKKMRFKSYGPNGSMFLNQNGDISKLKFEQDTVRIIIQKSRQGLGNRKTGGCMIPYSIQATFLLDNYYDVDKVIADHVLKGIVDTLEKRSYSKKHEGYRIYGNPFSIVYNPYYSGNNALQIKNRLMKNEYDFFSRNNKTNYLSGTFFVGEGLVRYSLSSMAEVGLQYNQNGAFDHNIFSLSVSPYLFFAKDANGNYVTYDNWFVNLDIGAYNDKGMLNWFGKKGTVGVGYLVAQNGDYFKNTTFKVFTDIEFVKGFTIVPEVIFTDNLKQVFPGFTLKVF